MQSEIPHGSITARFITANGLNFHVLDWVGKRMDRRLHGLASQAHIWDLVAPRLIDSFRVIAIDQRGHGLSDKPDNGYDFATITSDLDAILKAQHAARDRWCWPSFVGGNVALQYAVDHPDRVSGLVLIDGGFLQVGDRIDWRRRRSSWSAGFVGTPVDEFRGA